MPRRLLRQPATTARPPSAKEIRAVSAAPPVPGEPKLPFDIPAAFTAIREAITPFPKAALFELYEDDGFTTPFEQLVACILSIRTRDGTSIQSARRLFSTARKPAEIAALSAEEIDGLICDSTFHEGKARQIRAIAQRVAEEFGGELPCDEATLLSFHGVGIKCANLALGIACREPRIGVDIHVHRVTNRWGYVHAATPEKTHDALAAVLPREHWVAINRLLVPFGKHVCTGDRPKCSTCPVLAMCRQVGVTSHR